MSTEKIPIPNHYHEDYSNDLAPVEKQVFSEEDQKQAKQQITYEQNGNTITVQSTKIIGEYNYSFVSVSPTKKNLIDQPAMKRIKAIQMNDLVTWKGLLVEFISRPGFINLFTNRKYAKQAEYFKMEEERIKQFLEGILKFKELEDEKNGIQITAQKDLIVNLRGQEYVYFKPIKDPLQVYIAKVTSMQLMKDQAVVLNFQKPNIASQTNGFEQFSDLTYKLIKADGKLLKAVLESNGFTQTETHDWNMLWTCQSPKLFMYEGLNENQKINHFPLSYELTRKDRLCYNMVVLQEKFGREDFNIIPDTFILPDEFADFYSSFHTQKQKDHYNYWIIKPQNSSQGKGIYIIDDIAEVPIDEQCIVSKYIANPFLINGLKFDLRIYVLITSFDPWRIYIFNEGLVRFASDAYSPIINKSNKYAHLTNYSINKKNDKYLPNVLGEQDEQGHKWSFQAMTKHLEQMGVDNNLLWSKIYDVIIKSLLAVDTTIYSQLKKLGNKNNCFELLGYDILIDSDLKPWLMEVNISPSLATDTPLDAKVKSNLITDAFNLIGVKKFDRRRDNINKMKNKAKNIMRAKSYQSRQNNPNSAQSKQYNGRMREILKDTLQEYYRKGNFIRIYPSKNSDIYDQYFITSRPSNKFLFKCLYSNEFVPYPIGYPAELKPIAESPANSKQSDTSPTQNFNQIEQFRSDEGKGPQPLSSHFQFNLNPSQVPSQQHLQNTSANKSNDLSKSNINRTNSSQQKSRQDSSPSKKNLHQSNNSNTNDPQMKDKLLITGDDVLIEYVSRLMIAVKSIKENTLKLQWKNQIEKFIKHYVWHSSDVRRSENNKLWQRLESRLIEMKERRKRLLKSIYKKEYQQLNQSSKNSVLPLDFEKEYEFKEEQKNVIIQGFSAAQLEEMLRTSTKNVAYEVISCLIDQSGKGVLTDIIKWLTTNQKILNDNESILDMITRKKEVVDSDEEPESYVRPSTKNAHEIQSTHSTSSNQTEIRIKIRKNSMDPYSKLKANQQRLKEQQQQQQLQQSNQEIPQTAQSINRPLGAIRSPTPHQKQIPTKSSSTRETPQNQLKNTPSGYLKQYENNQKEEEKKDQYQMHNINEESSRNFQGRRSETSPQFQNIDTSADTFNKISVKKCEDTQGEHNLYNRRQTEDHLKSDSIKEFNLGNTHLSKLTSPIKPHDFEMNKNLQNSYNKDKMTMNNNYFKTYASNMKNELIGQTQQTQDASLINQSASNQQHQNSQLLLANQMQQKDNNNNIISQGIQGNGVVINNSSVSSIKKSGKSGRKTYSSVKKDIVEIRKNSIAKANKPAKN